MNNDFLIYFKITNIRKDYFNNILIKKCEKFDNIKERLWKEILLIYHQLF